MNGLAVAAKTTMEGLLEMDPGDIVEDLWGPFLGFREVLASAAFHHAQQTEKVATLTRVLTAATDDEKAIGGWECEGSGSSSEAWRTLVGCGSIIFVAELVEFVRVLRDNCVWFGVIVLVW